jgi:hypothetical protein
MKFKKIISTLTSLCLLLITTTTNATSLENLSDLPEISPYQEVINKLNEELGSQISIPDNETIQFASLDRNTIYNNIINQSLSDFEASLRNEFKEFENPITPFTRSDVDNGTRVSIPINPEYQANEIEPYAQEIRERIVQKAYLYNNNGESRGAVDLEAEVYSSGWEAYLFKYSTIYSMGYYTYTDRTHFRATKKPTYTLSSDRKNCTVKYIGSHFTSNGLMLTGQLTYTITYNAGTGAL